MITPDTCLFPGSATLTSRDSCNICFFCSTSIIIYKQKNKVVGKSKVVEKNITFIDKKYMLYINNSGNFYMKKGNFYIF